MVQGLVEPVSDQVRSLADWAATIAQLLTTFYGDQVLAMDDPQDRYTLQSLEHLRGSLGEFQHIPQPIVPHVTAAQAIEQLLRQVGSAQIPSVHGAQQIELLGWLELPLDMAPALVAVSFNEGCVPTSVNSDLFLPNALRRQLGLLDNCRRYARDAHALSVLLASREDLTLIAGRRNADGDPLIPSRLAFATDPQTMARRAREFFRGEPAGVPGQRVVRAAKTARVSGFVVRRPTRCAQPVTELRVTALRDYIACPYRYYLRHVLKLTSIDDAAQELGPDTFGNLLHDVLRQFGQDAEIRRETNPDKIRRFLHHALNQYVTRHYGTDPLPAIAIQRIQAQARLDVFADRQAERMREGWEIEYVETSGGQPPACLQLANGVSVTLRGRIDRIDHRDGTWAILDYKTGDTKKSPQATHVQANEWVDLQLPLYIHLAESLGLDGPLQLGYIVLPKDVSEIGVVMADWDEVALAAAHARAKDVAQRICNQEFWPPADQAPRVLTEYAAICQDYALSRNLEDDPRKEATT